MNQKTGLNFTFIPCVLVVIITGKGKQMKEMIKTFVTVSALICVALAGLLFVVAMVV